MRQQNGWAKCPMCEGSGEVETEKSKIDGRENSWDRTACVLPTKNMADDFRRENERIDKIPRHIPEYEDCQTCKGQEFKGLLPIYAED